MRRRGLGKGGSRRVSFLREGAGVFAADVSHDILATGVNPGNVKYIANAMKDVHAAHPQ